ncbi:MAG: DJ-1/PfpI family protein [Deltaproteobacteria bacterium]|nr:DJ-1/PfpI family protein [Deltaproteobacteria bacterium]
MAPRAPGPRPRQVAVLAFPGVQSLDVVGPLEVFGRTSRWLDDEGRTGPRYRTLVLAPRRGRLATSSGFSLVADRSATALPPRLDTLLVAGGPGIRALLDDSRLHAWLRAAQRRVRRLGSVCTGALLLARAGILDGRRATTHWRACERLAAEHPRVRVEPDAIFVEDRGVWTSAGVTSGMDLALALVEADHGRDAALAVARELVLFVRRPGGQSQFSAQLRAQVAERDALRDLQGQVLEHPEADCSVPALARRAGMSPRNFARLFTREVGETPARWVEGVRVEAARRRMEDGRANAETIAEACGFGTREGLRRAFRRRLAISPREYRQRFGRSEEARS